MGIITFDNVNIRDDLETEINGIRTGSNGEEYQTAGGAVRSQTKSCEMAIDELQDYILPQSILSFSKNASVFTNMEINYIGNRFFSATNLHAANSSFVPINVSAGAYYFRFDFVSDDGGNNNIRLFDTNKTTLIQVFTSGQYVRLTFSESKTVYLRVYLHNVGKSLSISNSIVANVDSIDEIDYLKNKIGYDQLDSQLGGCFAYVVDTFGASSVYSYMGMTQTKNGNAVNITTDAATSYLTYRTECIQGHKYALYYDLIGTYSGDNYFASFRQLNRATGSFVPNGTIQDVNQTSGTSARGTAFFTALVDCEISLTMPSQIGLNLSGSIFLYDVSEFSQSQLNAIDFSTIGSDAFFVVANGASGSSQWPNRKVVFYGDSITGLSYPEKVQSQLGFTLVKNAVGGSKFGYLDENSLSSDTRIAQLPSDADVVCIMGGTNDWQHTEIEQELTYNNGFDRTYFKGGVAYTVTKIKERCPSADVYLLTNIGGRGTGAGVVQPLPIVAPSGYPGSGNTPLKIRDATIEVANTLNVPVIDTWSCGIDGFNRVTYIADTVHPTDAGCKVIAEYIIGYLFNRYGY